MRRVRLVHATASRSSALLRLPGQSPASGRTTVPGLRTAADHRLHFAGASAARRIRRASARRARYFATVRLRTRQPDILGSVIRRHKYGPNQALGAVLAELLEEGISDGPRLRRRDSCSIHRRRLFARGFNQSALLAAAVTRKLRCRLDVSTLVRLIATPPQTAQDLESRRRNVHNAFAVRYPERIAAQKVLLVDDVLTTGRPPTHAPGYCARQAHVRLMC